MDIVDLYLRSVESFGTRVDAIPDDRWDASTPCSEWTVRDVVNHIVYEDRWAPELLGGKTLEEVGDRFEGDLLGDDPIGAWRSASADALESARSADVDGLVNVSWGQIPAREYIGQLFLDHLVHGWDVAVGAGGDTSLDAELVEACWAIAKGQESLIRASGVFGDDLGVPEDADTQTKLLALLGRRG